MSAPGFLAVGGVELANNARTVAYLQAGLGGSEFQVDTVGVCADLLQEAWPLTTCAEQAGGYLDQLYADPRPAWTRPGTGGAVTSTEAVWRESGTLGVIGAGNGGVVWPDLGVVAETVRLAIDVKTLPTTSRAWVVGRFVQLGSVNFGFVGVALRFQAGNVWELWEESRVPNLGGGQSNLLSFGSLPYTGPTRLWLEVVFGAAGFTTTLYGSDPTVPGASVILSGGYGYDITVTSQWFVATGVTEAASMAAATRTGISGGSAYFPEAEVVITEIDVIPGPPCTATGNLYPSETLFPSPDLYPGQYGYFVDPAIDGAPWADADRPESYGFLGLIVTDIIGLDTTSTRTMSDAADGIGGILGPTQLEPRDLEVRGYFIADGDQAMEYGRRWFAEVLGGSLCEGCGSDYVDLRSTCSGDAETDFYTNRWRLYDVGVTSFAADTSDPATCGRVTPVVFKLAAANPYLYGPELELVPATLLNPDGPDTPLVPFESWLFNDETAICATLADEQVGEQAPIFSFYGGTAGIESGLAYVLDPLYPAFNLYPDDDLFPGEDTISGGGVPFVFSFAVGPGERFVIDAAQRRVVRILADGVTQVDGSASLYMSAGDVISWPDTCAGDLAVCARAYAACTCDNTASVTITSMHRER